MDPPDKPGDDELKLKAPRVWVPDKRCALSGMTPAKKGKSSAIVGAEATQAETRRHSKERRLVALGYKIQIPVFSLYLGAPVVASFSELLVHIFQRNVFNFTDL